MSREDRQTPPDFEAAIRSFEDRIPFNKLLGLRVEHIGLEHVEMSFEKRPEMVGNFTRGILHGGVISAVLDTTGGLAAFVNAAARLEGQSQERQRQILSRIGTIDLRVDYLEAASGDRFRARGRTLRTGSRVAVTRMELYDDSAPVEGKATLVAVGTGTYIVG